MLLSHRNSILNYTLKLIRYHNTVSDDVSMEFTSPNTLKQAHKELSSLYNKLSDIEQGEVSYMWCAYLAGEEIPKDSELGSHPSVPYLREMRLTPETGCAA